MKRNDVVQMNDFLKSTTHKAAKTTKTPKIQFTKAALGRIGRVLFGKKFQANKTAKVGLGECVDGVLA